MLDRRHLIAFVEHNVGLCERRLDIAEAQLLMIVFVVIFEGVFRIGGIDRKRPRLERFLDIEHRRQLIIGDANQRHRFECGSLGGRDDAEDRLALVAHRLGRQRRLVVLAELDQAQQRIEIERHVGRSNDALDARRTRGRRIIDRADVGMRMRAAQDLQMQQVGEAMIVVIGRGAGDMPEHVLALGRLADFMQIVVSFVGEDVFAEFQHGLALQPQGRQ
jgi:hypothetical protein